MSGAAANICGQLQRRLKPTGCIQQRRFTPVPVVYSDAAYELRGLQLVSRWLTTAFTAQTICRS